MEKVEEKTVVKKEEKQEVELRFNGVAIASFVCAMVGIVTLRFPCGIAALITGIIGLVNFNKNKEKGRWMAITGIAVGGVEILFEILMIFLVAAMYIYY